MENVIKKWELILQKDSVKNISYDRNVIKEILYDIKNSFPLEEVKKLIYKFKEEELPDAESPFHCEAEIWDGMKNFIQWLEKTKQ